MKNYNCERLMVFIDEANITQACVREVQKSFNWEKFYIYLENFAVPGAKMLDALVYVGMPPTSRRFLDKFHDKKNYTHFLRSTGFIVVEKIGAPKPDGDGFKSNIDTIMCVDALECANTVKPDRILLCTGDADFSYLAQTLRRKGIRVTGAATNRSCSSEFKAAVNDYLDLCPLLDTFDDFVPNYVPPPITEDRPAVIHS